MRVIFRCEVKSGLGLRVLLATWRRTFQGSAFFDACRPFSVRMMDVQIPHNDIRNGSSVSEILVDPRSRRICKFSTLAGRNSMPGRRCFFDFVSTFFSDGQRTSKDPDRRITATCGLNDRLRTHHVASGSMWRWRIRWSGGRNKRKVRTCR